MSEIAVHPPLPLERAGRGSWIAACGATLLEVVRSPRRSFRTCPEPIGHGVVLALLATLRLPVWVVAGLALAIPGWLRERVLPIPVSSIHQWLDPALVEVLSIWSLLMIPVGIPVFYFAGGLLAHLGIALTGGAVRSIGASMRAVGYAWAPVALASGVLDVPLYAGAIEGDVALALTAVLALAFWCLSGIALAQTHRVSLVRGILATASAVAVWTAVTAVRIALEVQRVPLVPPPSDSPFYVP